MNEYIINPAWFYWVDVVDAVNCFAICSAIILLLGAGLVFYRELVKEGQR